jgi:RNA polymerase nonessential primary-like sigma factor
MTDDLETLWQFIDSLDQRRQLVLIQRFNLDGQGKRTLAAIAQTLSVTRERIRQLQHTALLTLRRRLQKSLLVQ